MAGKYQKSTYKIDPTTIVHWYEYGIILNERVIYLENDSATVNEMNAKDEVTPTMTNRFIKGMCLLETISNEPILIIMETPGGSIDTGFAIYDKIKYSPCGTRIIGTGQIMSMGLIILQAADLRELTPNTELMMHGGSFSVDDATPSTFMAWANANKRQTEKLYSILSEKMRIKNPKMTPGHVRRLCQNDFIMDAKTAINMGLADKLFNGNYEKSKS